MDRFTSDIWSLIYSYDATYIPIMYSRCVNHIKRQWISFKQRKHYSLVNHSLLSEEREQLNSNMEREKKINPYQDSSKFRISYNHITGRFIMKIDNFLYEKFKVKCVEVIQYNVHRDKLFYPISAKYPFQNLPDDGVLTREMDEMYTELCESIHMDNRVKSYEFMILLNSNTYIICEFGQHNGPYIEIYDAVDRSNPSSMKYFVNETYAKILRRKVCQWMKIYSKSTVIVRDMYHPSKNKKIKNSICTILCV